MIRYVIAVLFACAMMAVTVPAVDNAAALNGEKQVEQELAAIDEAANSLLYNEEVPASGVPGPTRELTVSFPQESLTSATLSDVVLDREEGAPITHATYHIDGRAAGQYIINAPLASETSDSISIEGGTTIDIQLRLEKDDAGEKVVILKRR